MYNQFMLQRNIDKLYPRKRQYKPGLLMQSSLVRARMVCRLLVQITKTKQGYRTTTVVTSLCTFWISGSQVNDINIPIGCKHCGQDLTREYAGKARRGVPRLRYENYNFAHVVVTGEYPGGRSPQPEDRYPVAPLKFTASTQDNRLSPLSFLILTPISP